MGPPAWVEEALEPVLIAIGLAANGAIDEAIALYREQVPDRDLTTWFDRHAQYVYKWRCEAQGVPKPTKIPIAERAPRFGSLNGRLPHEVFRRDSYRCRYCGLHLLSPQALRRFADQVGPEVFRITGEGNTSKAGPSLVFRPTADHVEPWSRGGGTNLANLVTACWPCNFGKMEYTVGELGIADPRTRPPVADGWSGLLVPEPAQ
jgi:5-methylcytosine-specific restriction endonuclease McrA